DIGLSFEPLQISIDLDNPVTFGFVAGSVEWTSGAISCPVILDVLDKSRRCFLFECADKIHWLSHGTDITILLSIIEKLIGRKAVFVSDSCFSVACRTDHILQMLPFADFPAAGSFPRCLSRIGRQAFWGLAVTLPVLG